MEPPEGTTDTLSTQEHDALHRYATAHGRRWKDALRVDWERARYPGVSVDDVTVLQQLRNSARFGPSGLIRYALRA